MSRPPDTRRGKHHGRSMTVLPTIPFSIRSSPLLRFDPHADSVGAGIYGGIVRRDPLTNLPVTAVCTASSRIRMLVTEVVNLGTERPSKIANIKKVSLKQHENLLGKNGQDREGMKQNHFYAQVHTNP